MARKPRKRPVYARRKSERDGDETPDQSHGSLTVRWWTAENPTDAAGKLWTWIDRLRQRWAADGITDLIHEAIYNDEPLGLGFDGQPGVYGTRMRRQSPANLNITMSMVDTATARLTKRRPMPVISADDAGWSEKLFAKRTSRILRRKMGGGAVEELSPNVLRDMCIRGTGCAKVIRNDGDVSIERIPIYEVVFDPRESYYSTPRSIAHVKPISRDVLAANFPECKHEIMSAPTFNRLDPWMMYVYQGPTFADVIEVAESWHLPSSKDADDGQHLICIRGKTLVREPWTRPRFPIARCFWSAPIRGYRGRGLVQQLAGIQGKVNDLLRDVQEALYYGGQLKVFVQRGSNVVKSQLRARHPCVIEYDGVEPHYAAPNPACEQSIVLIDKLIQKAYEISGISQMAAMSKNTLGANASGRAIDTMDDIQSDRFAHVESGYIQFRCDLARLVVDEARAMYEEATTTADGADDDMYDGADRLTKKDLAPWISEHDWKKVDIDGGAYHLTIEPINFLPDSRSGKLSFVAELSKAGLIPDPTMTASLFDEPDIARTNRSILGPYHNIERMLEDLADPSINIADCLPTMYTNPQLFVLMAKGEMEDAAANRAPSAVIDRYDQAIKYTKDLVERGQQSPSLPGMQAAQMGPSPNAATLQPGLGGGGPPNGQPGMVPPAGPPMPMAPPGMTA